MSRIESIPSLTWMENSAMEIAAIGERLLHESDFSWRLGDAAICGLIYSTFVAPPWLWFALAKGVTMRDLIDFRRLASHIPTGTLTAVGAEFEVGRRFAKFYGFSDIGKVIEYNNRPYIIMRKD